MTVIKALRTVISLPSILLLTICLTLPAKAHAKDKITWYVTDWAPFNITRGKLKRKGSNDKLIKYIHKFLPDYDLAWKNMNPALLEKAFTQGDNICQLDLFKTPRREKIAYFTKYPSIIDAPLRLFVKGKDEKKLNLSYPVKLDQLLNNGKFKAAFVVSRSYNTMIDNVLLNNTNTKITTNESTKRLIKDFFKGKNDYVVEYSAVMSYFKSTLKYKKDLFSLPIENTDPFVLGYAACSKTLWGKTTVDAIDAVLKAHRNDKRYHNILEQWHDDRSKQVIVKNYGSF
ncbi:MAG: TIGR02285 family protein [Psychrosphaera sp.]|nr:TIGR02285 family protein [Psychrosphaera sp.]